MQSFTKLDAFDKAKKNKNQLRMIANSVAQKKEAWSNIGSYRYRNAYLMSNMICISTIDGGET